jgi:hypothetical protein
VSWSLGPPALAEQCYRLLAVPATYSWLTKPEADRLRHGIGSMHGLAFLEGYLSCLARRPGVHGDVKKYLAGLTDDVKKILGG